MIWVFAYLYNVSSGLHFTGIRKQRIFHKKVLKLFKEVSTPLYTADYRSVLVFEPSQKTSVSNDRPITSSCLMHITAWYDIRISSRTYVYIPQLG